MKTVDLIAVFRVPLPACTWRPFYTGLYWMEGESSPLTTDITDLHDACKYLLTVLALLLPRISGFTIYTDTTNLFGGGVGGGRIDVNTSILLKSSVAASSCSECQTLPIRFAFHYAISIYTRRTLCIPIVAVSSIKQ